MICRTCSVAASGGDVGDEEDLALEIAKADLFALVILHDEVIHRPFYPRGGFGAIHYSSDNKYLTVDL